MSCCCWESDTWMVIPWRMALASENSGRVPTAALAEFGKPVSMDDVDVDVTVVMAAVERKDFVAWPMADRRERPLVDIKLSSS